MCINSKAIADFQHTLMANNWLVHIQQTYKSHPTKLTDPLVLT